MLTRKNKILAIVFLASLLTVSMFSVVQAKPGEEKNNPKFLDFVMHVEFPSRSDEFSVWRWNPPSVMDDMEPPYSQYLFSPPEGSRVLFVENAIWKIDSLPFPAERYVRIGGYEIDLQPGDFYSVYDVTWIYEADFGIYQLETTLTIDSPSYTGIIKLYSIERTRVDYESNVMIGEGTFVGHGVINDQKVKLSGERLVTIDLSFVDPPVTEETGTIQFLGNTP